MSRLPENDNIRNDIYENLPCQAMYNESVRKLKGTTTTNNESSETTILNNCNSNQQQHQLQTQLNLSLNANNKKSNHLPKELLYATPLRKSDRYKSNERSITSKNSHRYNNKIINNDEKKCNEKLLTNNYEYKLINKDNNIILKNCGSGGGKVSPPLSSSSPQILNHIKNNTNSEITNQHHQHHHHLQQQQHLEDRRILNFLKDTTQCQKKMEMISGGKDCPNASFSCLAREEHFANLVQQNFVIDQSQQQSSTTNRTENQESLLNNSTTKLDGDSDTIGLDATNLLDEINNSSILKSSNNVIRNTTEESTENLQFYMHNKKSPDKEVNGFVVSSTPSTTSILPLPRSHTNVYINREWVLKKIALCLEQRTSGKKCNISVAGKGDIAIKESMTSASAFLPRPQNIVGGNSSTAYHGCLVLGSNGSGKTSICQAIMNGNSGTKGILNRKLLSCYLVNSQNPDCHSLSIFIRSMVLQILSHSSLITKNDQAKIFEESLIQKLVETDLTASSPADDDLNLNKEKTNLNQEQSLCDNAEELLIAELKRNCEIDLLDDVKLQQKKIVTRQKSAPSPEKKYNDDDDNLISENSNNNIELINICDSTTKNSYSTHPPSGGSKSNKSMEKRKQQEEQEDDEKKQSNNDNSSKIDDNKLNKSSPGKKSKIPVSKTTSRTTTSAVATSTAAAATTNSKSSNTTIQQGGGEDIADVLGDDMKDEIEAEINDDHIIEGSNNNNNNNSNEITNAELLNDIETEQNLDIKNDTNEFPPPKREDKNETEQKKLQQTITTANNIPIPLPKPKSCRTIIADSYYEMLLSNPEIFECLNVDNIEKNPDECFKKGILFPLLELTPPRTALLLLIDSIDENYINEGNLISTLKGRTMSQKSRNIAELLSNHIHLFPKWLFLVCTTKKQTKHITKMFTGFKKITLDDLRKSHVVKDVQEYIINRLNSDFKGTINLTKEIIESLHQLYIKSNGCILYLEKVLNGIKENFFSFREIKLIPCTLNGLYLYICQKSFNKKQYLKIRPILNVLLASSGFVDRLFLFNCLRTYNYTIDLDEFEKRLDLMKNILIYEGQNQQQLRQQQLQRFCNNGLRLKIFHNSFADWLVDVKFATKKFICDVNEGHIMISMYYTLISESLCANNVRRFVYHLIKSGEYLTNKNINLDLILMLLESKINLNDCFYTNHLNCCSICENEYRNDQNFLPKAREMIRKFLMNELNDEISTLLCDFFKPSLPTDAKTLKLLIETGINNADSQASCDSSLMSPELSEKSLNIDFELADLLLSSEKTCQEETQRPKSSSDKSDQRQPESQDDNTSTLHQLSDSHRIEMHKGKALIHILASDGNHLLLERALNACKGPIDLEIEDYNGQTALNIAARNGHLDVVKLLLIFSQPLNDGTGRLKRVDVNHADRDGWTPLRSASWGGHTEVVKLLIAYPGCSIDLADKEGRTALRAAAWSGHEDILKILIEAGADVNSVDRQGRTSLIAASYMGHYDIVEILLDNGANVNHLDLDGRSALCVAALCGSSGYSKVISTLLEHGANTDQLDNDGMSPLLVSSFEGNGEVCELLLENGADPDLADFMGRTPLWAACTAGHANVVKLLLFWGCGIDCMDSEGRTVLSIAAAQGNVETVRQLLDRGLDETHRDNAGWTPLHYAAFEGFHDVCIQILESGAKIDECDNEGKTALHLAAQEGRQNCIQSLLEIHSSFVDQKAHDGKTAFRLACLESHIDCIQTLLKFGCDVNAKDADSRTTLYILALENKLEVVKYLIDVTDVDINIPDSEGRTALHVASWQGHSEMVKLLITLGNANVNAMDLELRSPLHSCAWQGNHDVMGILLYFGAIPDHACKQGATALGISAQEGHDKCVAILLKYGANPYKSDHCGRTPIKLAAKSNRNNILKIFESYTKTDESNIEQHKVHPNMLRSPDLPPVQGFLPHQTNQLIPNNNNVPPTITTTTNILNASSSTHSSNFYENTMQSDNSSLQKRKSVISSQSTGSSNDQVPLSFTQQLQRHTKLSSRNNPFIQNTPVINMKYSKGQQRHSQILPDLNEHQLNMVPNVPSNDADMFDMECMSPLYATPPHSPSSDLSSPGQMPTNHTFEEIGKSGNSSSNNGAGSQQKSNTSTDNHFARDTHMRIILGNCKDTNHSSSKSKRSGIATNPAMRMIRNRFDSAANLIRRTNNMLSSNSQGSSSIGVKSGTFQWRKESQM